MAVRLRSYAFGNLAAALAEAQLSAEPAAIAKVIDAAQQNLTNVDNVVAGLSQNLNISV